MDRKGGGDSEKELLESAIHRGPGLGKKTRAGATRSNANKTRGLSEKATKDLLPRPTLKQEKRWSKNWDLSEVMAFVYPGLKNPEVVREIKAKNIHRKNQTPPRSHSTKPQNQKKNKNTTKNKNLVRLIIFGLFLPPITGVRAPRNDPYVRLIIFDYFYFC